MTHRVVPLFPNFHHWLKIFYPIAPTLRGLLAALPVGVRHGVGGRCVCETFLGVLKTNLWNYDLLWLWRISRFTICWPVMATQKCHMIWTKKRSYTLPPHFWKREIIFLFKSLENMGKILKVFGLDFYQLMTIRSNTRDKLKWTNFVSILSHRNQSYS